MSAPDSKDKFARRAWLRALERTAAIDREPEMIWPLELDRLAEQHGSGLALRDPGADVSFLELSRQTHRYARWGLALGLQAGDVACLLMPNCAEYLAVWGGLCRIGVTVSLLNTQLVGAGLLHGIRIVAPKHLIVAAELAEFVAAIRADLPSGLAISVVGATPLDFAVLDATLAATSPAALSAAECPLPGHDATALYIYTSGTTGLPKAARVSHHRVLQWSHWFAGMLDTQPSDRMYDCLPLYHSVGGVVATGATLLGGGCVVIRRRFSASGFWRDVRAEGCTLFQYIGELCRYLVNAPASPDETQHALRIACGNGLRPEVWGPFQQRFEIPRILEYYASTEGSFSLYNCEGEPGSIGRIPPFLAARSPVALLRFDVEAGVPVRTEAGLCQACAADEVGEAVGLIATGARDSGGRFEGYADAQASAQKVLRNVLTRGDAWYRTGDLMRRDARGFYYFVDRVGETYRWKGENVSTTEVLSVLSRVPGVLEGVVYGVAIPGVDGRAGMAALVVDAAFDLATLRHTAERQLPGFARPVFVRLLDSLAATGTFKPKKHELAQAGFDPAATHEPVYVDDASSRKFVRLDPDRYAAILTGVTRL
jgi:fatty-acyl-CoA synthase